MGFPPQGSQRKYVVKKHPVKRKPESAAFSWKVEISSQEQSESGVSNNVKDAQNKLTNSLSFSIVFFFNVCNTLAKV